MNYKTNDVPWVEKKDYKINPYYNTLTEKQRSQVDFYADNGYLMLEDVDLTEHIDIDSMRKTIEEKYDWNANRVQDAWKFSSDVKSIACNENVLKTLEMLYGREMFGMQSLNFLRSTEQSSHSDYIHFNTLPFNFMCGVWVALENVGSLQGPLHYYEGSHKSTTHDYESLGIDTLGDNYLDQTLISMGYAEYEKKIKVIAEQYPYKELSIRKGQCLIWASNLIHGGTIVKDRSLTRFSQVTHYMGINTIPITPMLSLPSQSLWMVRDPLNIKTMTKVDRNYNGKKVVIPNGNHRVKLELPK